MSYMLRVPEDNRPRSTKNIHFYKSGDETFGGVKMPVNMRKYRTLDALLDDLSLKVPGLSYGVRRLATPSGKHQITKLDQLEHLGNYVCSDKANAKKVAGVDIAKIAGGNFDSTFRGNIFATPRPDDLHTFRGGSDRDNTDSNGGTLTVPKLPVSLANTSLTSTTDTNKSRRSNKPRRRNINFQAYRSKSFSPIRAYSEPPKVRIKRKSKSRSPEKRLTKPKKRDKEPANRSPQKNRQTHQKPPPKPDAHTKRNRNRSRKPPQVPPLRISRSDSPPKKSKRSLNATKSKGMPPARGTRRTRNKSKQRSKSPEDDKSKSSRIQKSTRKKKSSRRNSKSKSRSPSPTKSPSKPRNKRTKPRSKSRSKSKSRSRSKSKSRSRSRSRDRSKSRSRSRSRSSRSRRKSRSKSKSRSRSGDSSIRSRSRSRSRSKNRSPSARNQRHESPPKSRLSTRRGSSRGREMLSRVSYSAPSTPGRARSDLEPLDTSKLGHVQRRRLMSRSIDTDDYTLPGAQKQRSQSRNRRSSTANRKGPVGTKSKSAHSVSPRPARSAKIENDWDFNDEHEAAATKIQAGFRGYRTRREHRDRKQAATKIQANYRGYRVRKDKRERSDSFESKGGKMVLRELSERELIDASEVGTSLGSSPRTPRMSKDEAATKIQATYRGYQTRKDYNYYASNKKTKKSKKKGKEISDDLELMSFDGSTASGRPFSAESIYSRFGD